MREFKLTNNRKLIVDNDECGLNPRKDYDNLGTIVSWHSRYALGDQNINKNDYISSKDAIQSNSNKGDIVIPLYIYDHSGITISTEPFSCPWDSGQFGFIKVSKEKIRHEYNCKRVTKNILEKVLKVIQSEVNLYDKYLRGESYCMKIVDSNGEEEDSVYGFLGYNLKNNGILDHLSNNDKIMVESSL